MKLPSTVLYLPCRAIVPCLLFSANMAAGQGSIASQQPSLQLPAPAFTTISSTPSIHLSVSAPASPAAAVAVERSSERESTTSGLFKQRNFLLGNDLKFRNDTVSPVRTGLASGKVSKDLSQTLLPQYLRPEEAASVYADWFPFGDTGFRIVSGLDVQAVTPRALLQQQDSWNALVPASYIGVGYGLQRRNTKGLGMFLDAGVTVEGMLGLTSAATPGTQAALESGTSANPAVENNLGGLRPSVSMGLIYRY